MSAGAHASELQPDADLAKLAPRFRAAVEAALAECATAGLDACVFEGLRSQALQAAYYARGRTVFPPDEPVTNASSNLYSWHGYGLAVDVISRAKGWEQPEAWFRRVADVFARHGCAWGGDWTRPDLPHFQWGRCKPSPSDLAREIMAAQGMEGVWRAVGADGEPPATVAAADAGNVVANVPVAPHTSADVPPDIALLNLSEHARNAAIILRARFPELKFTSGRRALEDQARAMAGNVVKDRRFIVATYRASPLCTRCQEWVDGHPEAVRREDIAAGLLAVFQASPEEEVMRFSKHLTGDAFDVQPVERDAEAIKAFIRKLPLVELFLDREGRLIVWHAQFYR